MSNLKLITEHLNALPAPYVKKALANFEAQERENELTSNPVTALSKAFIWDRTPEGGQFWLEVSRELIEKSRKDGYSI